MNVRVTLAVTGRVLAQLRRDHRTMGMLFGVPTLLMILLKYIFDDREQVFEMIGGPLVGVFPFMMMFVISSIAMLRERTSGTLERLMTMPLAKADLLFGYGLAFALVAAVQAMIVSAVSFWLLGIPIAGPEWLVIVMAVCNAVLGMSLGLFTSAFAATEFQAVQFLPAFVFPQLLLSGLFVPREEMASALQVVSDFLPLTYAFDGLKRTIVQGQDLTWQQVRLDLLVVVLVSIAALSLGSLTLRRRTP